MREPLGFPKCLCHVSLPYAALHSLPSTRQPPDPEKAVPGRPVQGAVSEAQVRALPILLPDLAVDSCFALFKRNLQCWLILLMCTLLPQREHRKTKTN